MESGGPIGLRFALQRSVRDRVDPEWARAVVRMLCDALLAWQEWRVGNADRENAFVVCVRNYGI